MVKLTVLILGACVFIAQAAPYEDETLHRVIRSPHYGPPFHGGPDGPPPPPPPPFFYHTQNWSGVAGGPDNIPRGAFSGAAASVQGPAPVSNTAFSLAASGTNDDECDDNSSEFKGSGQYDTKSLQTNSQSFGSTSGFDGHTGLGSGEGKAAGYGHGSRGFSQLQNTQDFGQQSSLGDGGKTSGFNSASEGSADSGANGFGSGSFAHSYSKSKSRGFGSSNYQNGESETLNSQQSQSSAGFDKNKQSDSGELVNSQISSSEKNSGLSATFSKGSAESGSRTYGSGSFGHVDGHSKRHSFGGSNYPTGGGPTFNSQQSQLNGGFGENKQFSSGSLTSSHALSSSSVNDGGLKVGSNQGLGEIGSGAYESGHGLGYSKGFDSSNQQYDGSESINSQQSQLSGNGEFNSNTKPQSSGFENNGRLGVSKGSSAFESESSRQMYSADHGFGSGSNQAGGLIAASKGSDSGAGFSGHKQDYSGDGQIGYLSNGAIDQGQSQSALKGALDLASQGIQASDKSKCSTCQKGGYALSNAKSYSGSAIALSVGG